MSGFGEQRVPSPAALEGGNALYSQANCKTFTSKLLNPFGKLCFNTGTVLTQAAEPWVSAGARRQQEQLLRSPGDARIAAAHLRRRVLQLHAGYFAAKDELGLRINDAPAGGGIGQMDKAIYGLIDNVFTMHFRDAGHSIGHIYRLATNLQRQEVSHAEGSVAEQEIAELKKQALQQAKLPLPPADAPAPVQVKSEQPHAARAQQVKDERPHVAAATHQLTKEPLTRAPVDQGAGDHGAI
ncbi:MAG: hypothetical protein WDN72_06390 [Alphaproteobacteria bacterium]